MSVQDLTFRKGEAVVIHPADDADPEAVKHRGESCSFVRYTMGGHYSVVELSGSVRPMYFRTTDLTRKVEVQP